MGGRRGLVAAAAAALALAAAPGAAAGPSADAARIRRGLELAVERKRLPALDAARYRRSTARAVRLAWRLPAGRRESLAAVLRDVAAQSARYDVPRALTLFSTLDVNARHLARAPLPPRGTDVRDVDGVVYRSFPGRGLRYHPLGSFGRLNAEVTAGRGPAAYRLAWALLARARPAAGGIVWEYHFRYAGGRAPWTSGLVQAVAAQALARAGFRGEARQAYAALRAAHLARLPQGPWLRLYGFSGVAVLNAQLQGALSLAHYGAVAGDPGARLLARDLRRAARRSLGRFDTGFWSLYALGGTEAPLSYHRYVVSLLWKLSAQTGDRRWAGWAARFRDYWRKPPEVRPGPERRPAIPLPAEGFRDEALVSFWLSKPATVTLRVAGETVRAELGPGRRTLAWRPGTRGPGTYEVRLEAVDRVGNRTERRLLPAVVERDRTPPRVAVRRAGGRLLWRARDAGSPWVRARLVLRRGGNERKEELGRVSLRRGGPPPLPLPAGRVHATLVAVDSAGNETVVPLGAIGGQPGLPRGLRAHAAP